MRVSIQEEGKEKRVFFTFREASDETGIPLSTIYRFIKGKTESNKFMRKSDKKVFFIQEEIDEKLITIGGEDFSSFNQIIEKFQISPVVFLNQISRKKSHFLDAEEVSHQVDWISPKMEKFLETNQRDQMARRLNKCHKKGTSRLHKKGYEVFLP